MQVDNVIVDGLNLAYRCYYAPGMAELHDSNDRPTGVVCGFLKTLVSLTKKFEGAKYTVVWDGSSQYRRSKFSGYKANRTSGSLHTKQEDGVPSWDQIKYLTEILPFLGVAQAYNPQEEADDVMATLVRENFCGFFNIILTNDRDMLQLITSTDNVLLPTQGKRKEAIFDIPKLKEEWGVEPELMVPLRALFGDSSDNIPGVPRVPQKVLTNLLVKHRSINGIYESNLSGLTELQYRLMMESEKQVRLNLELMSLRNVPVTYVAPTPDTTVARQKLASVEVVLPDTTNLFAPTIT